MTVALVSKASRPLTLHLEHDRYCTVVGRCSCGRARGEDSRFLVRVPASLHLLVGAKLTGLPEAVLKCADVLDAIKSGQLVVVEEAKPKSAVVRPTAKPVPPQPAKKTEKPVPPVEAKPAAPPAAVKKEA